MTVRIECRPTEGPAILKVYVDIWTTGHFHCEPLDIYVNDVLEVRGHVSPSLEAGLKDTYCCLYLDVGTHKVYVIADGWDKSNTVTITVTPPLEVLVRVTGKVTAGKPAPDMTLEILDKDVAVESKHWVEVAIDESRSLEAKVTEPGDHEVYGRMTLENPVGRVSYETPRHRFTL